MEQSLQPVPPRTMNVPQTPQPQTCFGILGDYGIPSGQENITDVPPDFGWMTGIEQYLGSFSYDNALSPKNLLTTIYPNAKKIDPKSSVTQQAFDFTSYIQWHTLPFTTARWWSGNIVIRFMAIKPPRATGKIIIQYVPDVGRRNVDDSLFRSIKMEWDLGQSSEFIFEVPALNVSSIRPTWIPRFSNRDNNKSEPDKRWVNWNMAVPQWSFGCVKVYPAQKYQPGSLFPDNCRILVFQSFKNAQFYTTNDPRSSLIHSFSSFTPLQTEDETPKAYKIPL